MKIIFSLIISLLALSSCVKEPEYSGDEMEGRALRAWIKKNRPELLGNYQQEGGYYVDVLAWGDTQSVAEGNDLGSAPIMEQDTCWIYYNINGYDLDGNLCTTRDEILARMQATYSDRTHYVPYANFCGENEFYAIVEGTYLAARNKITLSKEYIAREDKKDICKGTELIMRKGTKVRLYMTSTIGYGSSGSSSDGGYEGQYSLDTNVPLILDMEITRVVKNPSETELDMVNTLVKNSNEKSGEAVWLQIENKENKDSDSDEDITTDKETDSSDNNKEEKKYYEGIYYSTAFKPNSEFAHLQYARPDMVGLDNPYKDSQRYADMAEFDKKLWEILDKKFEKKINKTSDEDAKVIGEDNAAMIWYVGRFLDGYIFDTNIDEVKELAFNEKETGGSAISYSVSSNKEDYINAWAHCIPNLRYARWGAIITTSGYAYGTNGVSASTSTSSSSYSYYNMMNYYNYYNSMSSYYYNPYGYYNYYNYYGGYNNYYNYDETTTTIETEIMPYTPLVFYVFIEPTE